jgi:hypothetical protein
LVARACAGHLAALTSFFNSALPPPETTGWLKHQTVKTVAARMVVKFTVDDENFLPGVPPINFAAGFDN